MRCLPTAVYSVTRADTDDRTGLVNADNVWLVTHENRPIAIKNQIYDILVSCHGASSHGGRDKTSAHVRRFYSWIPKELIARFVKICPLCNARRTANKAYFADSEDGVYPVPANTITSSFLGVTPKRRMQELIIPAQVPSTFHLDARHRSPVPPLSACSIASSSGYEASDLSAGLYHTSFAEQQEQHQQQQQQSTYMSQQAYTGMYGLPESGHVYEDEEGKQTDVSQLPAPIFYLGNDGQDFSQNGGAEYQTADYSQNQPDFSFLASQFNQTQDVKPTLYFSNEEELDASGSYFSAPLETENTPSEWNEFVQASPQRTHQEAPSTSANGSPVATKKNRPPALHLGTLSNNLNFENAQMMANVQMQQAALTANNLLSVDNGFPHLLSPSYRDFAAMPLGSPMSASMTSGPSSRSSGGSSWNPGATPCHSANMQTFPDIPEQSPLDLQLLEQHLQRGLHCGSAPPSAHPEGDDVKQLDANDILLMFNQQMDERQPPQQPINDCQFDDMLAKLASGYYPMASVMEQGNVPAIDPDAKNW